MLNPQEITQSKTPRQVSIQNRKLNLPEEFYSKGYAYLEDIPNFQKAQEVLEESIFNIDTTKLPIYKLFLPQIQLVKRDQIPICNDSVETSFQALHFDMGQPIFSTEPQNMYLITGLYIPAESKPKTARTRVISLKGLFAGVDPKELEKKIIDYVREYGDGWFYPSKVNTYRISCFARILDALSGTTELADYIDKTMAQWFQDSKNKDGMRSMDREKHFYLKRGVDLDKIEEDIVIKPGALLIVDNMRTAHGRIGKRDAKETWQFMYGVNEVSPKDIDSFRKSLIKNLTAK